MEIKKILFVTRFEDLCFDALQSLLVLRQASLKHVVFINVIERDNISMYRTGYKKDEVVRLKEKANIRFIDWAENLFEQGMEVGVYIVVGSLVSQVITAAKKEEADLIVIGRSQKGVLKQLYSGSDIVELIRRSYIPVLVFKHISEIPKILDRPFEKVLLAIDWSLASLRAVEYLRNMKKVVKHVDVIHVLNEADISGISAMEVQKARKESREKLEIISDQFESDGISSKAHVYVGKADEEIERAARECQATMIVLGSSSKPSWMERWLGSTPRAIAEKSIYPTLLIPPKRDGD